MTTVEAGSPKSAFFDCAKLWADRCAANQPTVISTGMNRRFCFSDSFRGIGWFMEWRNLSSISARELAAWKWHAAFGYYHKPFSSTHVS